MVLMMLNTRIVSLADAYSCLGAYLPLAIMGIQAMLRREKRQWITLTYSLLMLILTTAWYTTTTYANEVSLVELRYNPDNKNAEACVPVNIAATAVSSLQFALSDLLLVRPSTTSRRDSPNY
jgi:hypothetical protein